MRVAAQHSLITVAAKAEPNAFQVIVLVEE
jgi:hypothetical protein